MSWYKTGTVNVTDNSKIVTGVNTKWTNPLIGISSGQMLILQTSNTIEIYEIASVQSDTQLTLAKAYSGTSKTDITYEIPTVPKVSIEALALRISEMLNYYQQQMEGWQTALTGEGEVTVTAPDGRVVTIKSQYSIQKELIQLVDQSKDFAQSASKSAITATDSASVATTSSDTAKIYADNANNSAKEASQSAINSANSAKSANTSEVNAKSSEIAAKNSADNAKEWASTVDSSNFIKKSGDEKQCINGKLDVNLLTENGYRVFSLNNSDIVGAFRLMPFRANELPFGWYFRNGDNYLLDSPQGQVLNRLSDNYKRDHQITIKDINGHQYINVPSAFAPDGRGYFERPANGTTRQVGSAEDDAIRNLYGEIHHIFHWKDTVPNGVFRKSRNDDGSGLNNRHYPVTCHVSDSDYPEQQVFFNASWFVPTAHENRPINMGMTPAIYLGV